MKTRRTNRPRRIPGPEPLECRRLMAADLGSPDRLVSLAWNGRTVEARPDAWIVRTSAPVTDLAVAADWRARSLGEGFYALATPGASVADVTAWAARTTGVAYVEPDAVLGSAALPNDPSFDRLWGLDNLGQSGGTPDADIDAPEAWDVTTGSRSVVVAVIDTGVDYRHPELAANIWTNTAEIPGNGRDDDNNGFVDDVRGWDFVNGDADPFDDNGHGTHVAGTIGAVGDDGKGVVGVAWQVSIMPLKFLSGSGSGSTSDAIAAINYVTMMRRDFGINVVATNNSWGGGGFSTALLDAIEAGGRAGILFVAAAGNERSDVDRSPSYPAAYVSDAIISVAATTRTNSLASFSNYGVVGVDVAAPGESIYSTTPNDTHAVYSGTSMATPHVVGVIALMAAANPLATAADLRSTLFSTVTPVAVLEGKVATGGLVNAAAAVRAISGPIEPPDPDALSADIVNVAPDPRSTAVEAVTVVFSRAVTGFDVGDLRLTRDGLPVSLAAASVSTADNVRWTISGLTAATATDGGYVLTLEAAASGIEAAGGRTLAASVSDSWIMRPPVPADVGDSIGQAAAILRTVGSVRVTGLIGDGPYGDRDVDFHSVRLTAGQRLTIDIDARTLPGSSPLDSFVRVFDKKGKQVAFNDDDGTTFDSRLVFTARSAGNYFVGISGYGNQSYAANRGGSGRAGSTGDYQATVTIEPPPSRGGGKVRIAGFRDEGDGRTQMNAFAAYGSAWQAGTPAMSGRSASRGILPHG